MRNIEYSNLADFLEYIGSLSLTDSFLFRGQRNFHWKLQNRWSRFKNEYPFVRTDVDNFRELLKNKTREELRKVGVGREVMTDAELEAFSQHNGAPTRLMDWSRSPYIALFFAFDAPSVAKSDSEKCAVFELSINRFVFAASFKVERNLEIAKSDDARKHAFSKDVNVSSPRILDIQDRDNQRAIRQDGFFLIIPDDYEFLEIFEDECICLHPESEFLTKHVIPNKGRIEGVRHLQDMGCRASSVYCDASYASVDATMRALSEY